MTGRRNCKGTNKAGQPCKATPPNGSDHCRAHDPNIPEEDRFGGKAQSARAGGSRKPRHLGPVEAFNELVRSNVLAFAKPYLRAAGLEGYVTDEGTLAVREAPDGGAKLHGTRQGTGDVIVSEHDDLEAMQRAVERILDRGFGRPRQGVEHTGPGGGPVAVEGGFDLKRLSNDELRQLRGLLERAGEEPNG